MIVMCMCLMLSRCLVIFPRFNELPALNASPFKLLWVKLQYLFVFGVSWPPKPTRACCCTIAQTINAKGTRWSVFSVSTFVVSESKMYQTSAVDIMLDYNTPASWKWRQAHKLRTGEVGRRTFCAFFWNVPLTALSLRAEI